MSNELYTFAEPVQVVPFSSLKWGKFTLLHTVIDKDWSTRQYGTFGYEPEFDDEYYDEDGEVKLTDEEIVNYVDDLFHDIYEIEDLVDGIRRSSYANFWDPVESVEDICKELFEFRYFQYPQYLESQK